MIRTILFIFSLCITMTVTSAANEHRTLPYAETLKLLQDVNSDAIILGEGKKHIYVFIDPMCPHSRKFIRMVSENERMLSKYQYHLLLYSIPRLKSEDVVSAVFTAKKPLEVLLDIMVHENAVYDEGNLQSKARVMRIDEVAHEIDVYKRPYIFIVK